jgi:hypothetical protein
MLERGPELSWKQSARKGSVLDTIQNTLDTAVEDGPANGVYRVGRDIFTDPEIFELEMTHIFEGNWIYLAHESQIPNKNDYYTTYMGRQPIFIARNRDGELNAFINACAHRGAMLCRFKRGDKATYTKIPGFSFFTCVAAADSAHPRKGYVTAHAEASHLNGGDVDLYLCGPPAMVDAVRAWLAEHSVTPTSFYCKKFSPSGAIAKIGEAQPAPGLHRSCG